MRHAPSTLHLSHAFRRPASADGIEWEELPSLASSLSKRLVSIGERTAAATADAPRKAGVWEATMPAELDDPKPLTPFRQPFDGVVMREVSEPDVFRHFFGS